MNCVYDRHRCNSRGAHRDYKESHVCGLDSWPEVSPWGARHGTGGGYVCTHTHCIPNYTAGFNTCRYWEAPSCRYPCHSNMCVCLLRLQLHGLWDVQTKPACWIGGRPQAGIRGQEGQTERAAASHPEIQDCLHRVCQEGKEVSYIFVLFLMPVPKWAESRVRLVVVVTLIRSCFLMSPQVRWSPVSISGCSSRDHWRRGAGYGDPVASQEVP